MEVWEGMWERKKFKITDFKVMILNAWEDGDTIILVRKYKCNV